MVRRIYVGDHITLLHTKSHGFREEFPIISLWKLMTPGCGHFGPQWHGWQNLCWGWGGGALDNVIY